MLRICVTRIDLMRTTRFLIYSAHPAARGGVLHSEKQHHDRPTMTAAPIFYKYVRVV
jgi:hypothetical protein